MKNLQRKNPSVNVLGLCVSILMLIPALLLAQAPAAQDEANRAVARKFYQNGKAYFDSGKYAEARNEFQSAYDAQPHPVVLKSIAECSAALGELTKAIESYKQFVQQSDPKGKKEGEARISELQALLGTLSIYSDVNGSTITVDGKSAGGTAPTTVNVDPGPHEVTIVASGYQPLTKQVTLEKGAIAQLRVDFSREGTPIAVETAATGPEVTPAPPAEDTAPVVEEEKASLPPAFWIAAAVTGVGAVTGGVFGAQALKAEDDYQADPTDDNQKSGKTKALVTDISLGVAAASAVVGTVILIVHGTKEKKVSDGGNVAIVPVTGPNTVGLNATVTF